MRKQSCSASWHPHEPPGGGGCPQQPRVASPCPVVGAQHPSCAAGIPTSPLPPQDRCRWRPCRKELLSLIVPSSAGSDNGSFLPHASGRAVGLAARGRSHGAAAWCGAAPQLQPARCPAGISSTHPGSPVGGDSRVPRRNGVLPAWEGAFATAWGDIPVCSPQKSRPPPAGLWLRPHNPVPTLAHRLICWLIPQAINTALPQRALQPPCWPLAHPPLSPKREGGEPCSLLGARDAAGGQLLCQGLGQTVLCVGSPPAHGAGCPSQALGAGFWGFRAPP